jgi:hypothetical protein
MRQSITPGLDTLHWVTLIFVNGVSGSGKSAVCHELRARGFEAFDVDEDGFKSWYGKANDRLAVEQRPWSQTTVEWRNRYWLKIERDKVEALATAAAARSGPTFLCGTGPNEDAVWDLFDKLIHLSVSNETLRQRLATRSNNDFGKDPRDLIDILGWTEFISDRNIGYRAVAVNVDRRLEDVVDEVIGFAMAT